MKSFTGQKFGRLTVVGEGTPFLEGNGGNPPRKRRTLMCLCECGTQTEIRARHLLRGAVKSCGCLRQDRNTENKRIATSKRIGQKFGLLTIIGEGRPIVDKNGRGKKTSKTKMFLCLCDCGTYKEIRAKEIIHGRIKSCGCLVRITDAEAAYLSSAKRVHKCKYSDGDLTFDDFLVLSRQNCYYCNDPPSNVSNHFAVKGIRSTAFAKENGYFTYNGLDRVDSSKPHTKENVVPCCKWCNYAKRERTIEEFREWISRLVHFLNKSI